MAGQFVKVIAKEIRAVLIGGSFEGEAEIEQMFGERDLYRRGKGYG